MTSAEPLEPVPVPVRLSPITRAGRIFARPATAWDDLVQRGQWVPPLLAGTLLWVGLQAAAFRAVSVPMMVSAWTDAVANGSMEQATMDQMTNFYQGPMALWITLGTHLLFWPIVTLLVALVVWFGCSFVLGTSLRYRQALDVVCWSGIVTWPAVLLTFALAWQKQTFKGIHLGLGALIPEGDTPDRLRTGITTFLDFLAPFEAWRIAVAVIGVAALTQAPRRNVAWVLVALYLAFGAFLAAVNALFNPGA